MTDKPQKPIERARAELDAVKNVEEIIRLALIALEQKTGRTIDEVTVRTISPNYERLEVEIWLT